MIRAKPAAATHLDKVETSTGQTLRHARIALERRDAPQVSRVRQGRFKSAAAIGPEQVVVQQVEAETFQRLVEQDGRRIERVARDCLLCSRRRGRRGSVSTQQSGEERAW